MRQLSCCFSTKDLVEEIEEDVVEHDEAVIPVRCWLAPWFCSDANVIQENAMSEGRSESTICSMGH